MLETKDHSCMESASISLNECGPHAVAKGIDTQLCLIATCFELNLLCCLVGGGGNLVGFNGSMGFHDKPSGVALLMEQTGLRPSVLNTCLSCSLSLACMGVSFHEYP